MKLLRLASGRPGLFAARSPNRPSPTGLSFFIVKCIYDLGDEINDDVDGNEEDSGNVEGRYANNNNKDNAEENCEDR